MLLGQIVMPVLKSTNYYELKILKVTSEGSEGE